MDEIINTRYACLYFESFLFQINRYHISQKMTERIRCFIALDLPKGMVSELKKVQNELEKQNLFIGKLTEEENIHLTLKFFGSISEDRVEQIRRSLKQVKFNKFSSEIKDAGVFAEDFVRIIWVLLNGNEVHELQLKIDDNVETLFPREERFMSHITIARVKSLEEKQKLIDYVKNIKMDIKGNITSFSLIKSTLKPSGAEFEVIEKYKLE